MPGQKKKSGIHGFSQKKRAKAVSSAKASQKKQNKQNKQVKNARNAQKRQRDKHAQQNALKVSAALVSSSEKPKKKKKVVPKTVKQKQFLADRVKKNQKKQRDAIKKEKYGR